MRKRCRTALCGHQSSPSCRDEFEGHVIVRQQLGGKSSGDSVDCTLDSHLVAEGVDHSRVHGWKTNTQ